MSQKLTTKQILAARLLASGITALQASAQLKLRRETLSRWKQNPYFRHEIQMAIGTQMEDAQCRLRKLVEVSLMAIERGLNAGCAEPEKRVQVAISVLRMLKIDTGVAPNDAEMHPSIPENSSALPSGVSK